MATQHFTVRIFFNSAFTHTHTRNSTDASMFGHEDIVRMLLKHNADIHIRGGFNGSTPLHFAVRHSHYDIVNLLIQNGADVNAKDYSGNSVLCVASEDKKFRSASEYKKFCSSKSVACVLRLLICGAKIDDKALQKDSFNMLKHIKKGTRNRLYFAAIYGLFDLTSELLYKGETIVNYENYMWEMDRTCLLEKLTSGKKGRFSKLERKAFEDIAFVFIRKIPTVAFKVFCGVRSCMTYVGLCCARGFTQSDNDEIDKYPYKYPYFTYIRLDRHFLDYYSYFDAKSSDPVISSRRRWIRHSPRLRYHGHTESMPAGITKKWHHDNSIYCLLLEYSYVYSHEDNFWVWKYQSVNPTMIAAQEA